jgi:hypothetical protein
VYQTLLISHLLTFLEWVTTTAAVGAGSDKVVIPGQEDESLSENPANAKRQEVSYANKYSWTKNNAFLHSMQNPVYTMIPFVNGKMLLLQDWGQKKKLFQTLQLFLFKLKMKTIHGSICHNKNYMEELKRARCLLNSAYHHDPSPGLLSIGLKPNPQQQAKGNDSVQISPKQMVNSHEIQQSNSNQKLIKYRMLPINF